MEKFRFVFSVFYINIKLVIIFFSSLSHLCEIIIIDCFMTSFSFGTIKYNILFSIVYFLIYISFTISGLHLQ
ncbi:hypothetical protein DW968_19950 [Bacteroides fragilis]|nr:hypothetical protein DW968_19950 [Bacteroides fragilis]